MNLRGESSRGMAVGFGILALLGSVAAASTLYEIDFAEFNTNQMEKPGVPFSDGSIISHADIPGGRVDVDVGAGLESVWSISGSEILFETSLSFIASYPVEAFVISFAESPSH